MHLVCTVTHKYRGPCSFILLIFFEDRTEHGLNNEKLLLDGCEIRDSPSQRSEMTGSSEQRFDLFFLDGKRKLESTSSGVHGCNALIKKSMS